MAWIPPVVAGIVLLIIAILLIHGNTRPGVTYERVSFTTEGLEENPVTISGLLMKPTEASGPLPGVVFAHGIFASKEWYVQMTRPMVQAGFAVLAIDLRGHGGSTGYCNFGNEEVKDIWAAAQYLRTSVPEVNPSGIVAMGHSLGGISSTRAGALQPDDRISGVVAVYCWTSWKDALQDLLGPIDDLVGRGWQFVTFSEHADVNALDFEQQYSVMELISDNRPPNYLLEIGLSDELAAPERARQIMAEATKEVRRTGPEDKLEDGHTYGDFASGTARRLVLAEDNHVTELVSGVITLEAIQWIKQVNGIPINPDEPAPLLWWRVLGLVALGLAVFLLCVGSMSAVRGRLFAGGEGGIVIEPPWGAAGEQGIWEIMLYAAPILVASYLSLPVAKMLGLGPFIPYTVVNELSLFYLSRTVILLPVFVALLVAVIIREGGISKVTESVKGTIIRWAKSAGYALIPLAIILVAMLALGGPLVLPRPVARLPLYGFIGIVCVCAGFWMEDYLFYKLVFPALEKRGPEKALRYAVLLHGVVLGLVLVVAFMPIVRGLNVSMALMGFRLPLVVLMLVAIPAFVALAWVSLRMRKLTGGSLAYALLVAVLAVWLFTGPISVRGF